MSTALGNRIKALRQKHNLSQSLLAEQLGFSHAYIGFLEKGIRSGTEETIRKIAEFFRVDPDELLSLRDEKLNDQAYDIKTEKTGLSSLPPYMEEFVNLLMKLEENTCKKIIEEFKSQLQQKLYSLLTPYELKEVKQMVLDVKRYWLSLIKNEHVSEPMFHEKLGYIPLDEKELFFKLQLDESALSVTLLYAEQNQITMFENWLGESNVRYLTEMQLPHLSQPQKVARFIWFSPSVSVLHRFQYLLNHNINVQHIDCSEHQLNWYIQQYLLEQHSEASAM
ncbi:helix-turn-helix transcriptional regulator [Geobacillus sp. E263]|uniref:helix-turn-helix domain-containing protein n=1 Tax=Geobacillus sp. E263 TaxID=391290 RepID=UPI00155F236C|nr:helix-turn-helix transcriptional regulator [Geobacillus sp. E263]